MRSAKCSRVFSGTCDSGRDRTLAYKRKGAVTGPAPKCQAFDKRLENHQGNAKAMPRYPIHDPLWGFAGISTFGLKSHGEPATTQ